MLGLFALWRPAYLGMSTDGMKSVGNVKPKRKRCTPGNSVSSVGTQTVAFAE